MLAWRRVALRLALLATLLAGCYRDLPETPTPFRGQDLPPPPHLTPTPVLIDGSALMQPLSEALAAAFRETAPEVPVVVGASGTRSGIARFCAGEFPLLDALRPITDDEAALCREHGITWEALAVAHAAVAVVVPAENDFAGCLTLAQLRSLWRADSPAQTWRQVNLGYPDVLLAVYAPPEDTLAFTLFREAVLGGGAMRAARYEGVPVGGDAVGFLGWGEALRRRPSLRWLAVDSGDGACVAPDEGAIREGRYALARALWLVVDRAALARPEVARFLRFVLSGEADGVIREMGLVPPSEASRWEVLGRLGL